MFRKLDVGGNAMMTLIAPSFETLIVPGAEIGVKSTFDH